MPTPEQAAKAIVGMALAIGDAIKDLGEVPSGHLYARVMGHMSLETYETIIGLLKEAGVVEETPAHLLRWIGKKEEVQS